MNMREKLHSFTSLKKLVFKEFEKSRVPYSETIIIALGWNWKSYFNDKIYVTESFDMHVIWYKSDLISETVSLLYNKGNGVSKSKNIATECLDCPESISRRTSWNNEKWPSMELKKEYKKPEAVQLLLQADKENIALFDNFTFIIQV